MMLLRVTQWGYNSLVAFYLEADACAVPERTRCTSTGARAAGWVAQVKIPGSKESVQLKGAAGFP